jgi:ABC-type microcin C transport system permease subunit YejB
MVTFWRYVGERLIICLATIALSSTIVFFAPRLVPGDPLGAVTLKLSQMGGNRGSPELVAEYTRRFGLDKSPLEQYGSYLRQMAQGDMGYSIASFPSTVGDLLKNALPWTVGLLLVTTSHQLDARLCDRRSRRLDWRSLASCHAWYSRWRWCSTQSRTTSWPSCWCFCWHSSGRSFRSRVRTRSVPNPA